MKSYQTGIRKAIILHANQAIKNILFWYVQDLVSKILSKK
jgi:hypothetical protein